MKLTDEELQALFVMGEPMPNERKIHGDRLVHKGLAAWMYGGPEHAGDKILELVTDLIETRVQVKLLREALEGIAWSAGSNTAVMLPAIKRRAEEALADTPPKKLD
jgi:hypothetical protein